MSAPMSGTQLAQRWSLPAGTVRSWCRNGVFPGAFRIGNRWAIPLAAVLLREDTTSEAVDAAR